MMVGMGANMIGIIVVAAMIICCVAMIYGTAQRGAYEKRKRELFDDKPKRGDLVLGDDGEVLEIVEDGDSNTSR